MKILSRHIFKKPHQLLNNEKHTFEIICHYLYTLSRIIAVLDINQKIIRIHEIEYPQLTCAQLFNFEMHLLSLQSSSKNIISH